MKAVATGRTVINSADFEKGRFGISVDDSAHLMVILRDTLYTDKVLAVLREYGANAWDAHRMAGKNRLPIQVRLPTSMVPTLTIRDFGTGLSEDDVFHVYTQYGASTKRDTNRAVGSFGLGCKSGFCYSDSFTITSWHGGWKRVYVAVLDASDVGEIQKLHEEPCGPEVGLEVKIPTRPGDNFDFQRKAGALFQHFDPQPDINLPLAKLEKHDTPHGYITTNSDSQVSQGAFWVAVMGCVPYRVDIHQVEPELNRLDLWEPALHLSGGLYFDIGTVQISASREELKYSDTTKKAIVRAFRLLIDYYVNDAFKSFKSPRVSWWSKHLKAQYLTKTLKRRLPERYQGLAQELVSLANDTYTPTAFTLRVKEKPTSWKIPVKTATRIVIQDDPRAIRGFPLTDHDRILTPAPKCSLAQARADLDVALKGADLTGIPIVNLSSMVWTQPYRGSRSRSGKTINEKHRISTFVLKPDLPEYRYPKSSCWDSVKREPTPEDVYVPLSYFEITGDANFYQTYVYDRLLVKALGTTLPPVYGYKKVPGVPCGTPYKAWQEAFFQRLVTDEIKALFQSQQWLQVFDQEYMKRVLTERAPTAALKMGQALGAAHPVTQLFVRYNDAARSAKTKLGQAAKLLAKRVPIDTAESTALYDKVVSTYPLLQASGDKLAALVTHHQDQWIHYIRLIDRDVASTQTQGELT